MPEKPQSETERLARVGSTELLGDTELQPRSSGRIRVAGSGRRKHPETTQKMKLTKEHKEAMRAVTHGADVSGYSIARLLREVERHHPELITICKVMGDYDGAGHVPYFGAILTKAGRRAVGKKRVKSGAACVA